MSFVFGKKSQERIATVEHPLQKILYHAIAISPIDFGIPQHGGRRDEETQYELFRTGKSKCDGVKIKSRHQSGEAIDIYAFVNGKASWDPRYLSVLAGVLMAAAKDLGYVLKWGGDFDRDWNLDEGDSWDMGHFELVGEFL